MTKRNAPEPDLERLKVKISLPVFYEKDDSSSFDFGVTKSDSQVVTDVVEAPR